MTTPLPRAPSRTPDDHADATPARAPLRDLAMRRFALSSDVATRFFDAHAGLVGEACRAMATRFEQGGRLLVFGVGAEASDAQHVAVEFVHPVVVGKRALPAIALRDDGRGDVFAPLLATLARRDDIALGLSRFGRDEDVRAGLDHAHRAGMLTLALTGGDGGSLTGAAIADFAFVVPSGDPMVVQEAHEMLYHVLWELVHVFFDARVTQ